MASSPPSSSSWFSSWSAWGSTLAADISTEVERLKAEREQAKEISAEVTAPPLSSEPLFSPKHSEPILIATETPLVPENQSSLVGRLYEWKDGIEKEALKLKEEIEKEVEARRKLREAEIPVPPPPLPTEEKSSGKEEITILDQMKKNFDRPIEIADQNYNPLSKDVADDAKKTRENIIAEVHLMEDSLEKQRLVLGSDPPLVSTSAIAPSTEELPSIDPQQTIAVIDQFEKRITAYITFFTLHEIIAGRLTPKNEHGEPVVYQEMIQHVANHPEQTLWEIYYAKLGHELDWLPYIKVRLFYFLFYSVSNLIPKVIRELLVGVVQGLRARFSQDSYHLDNFAGISLSYGEVILSKLSQALDDFSKGDANSKASLDEQKAAAVMSLFQEELPSLIQRDSAHAIDLFFSQITFCELGQTSSIVPVRWLGSVISSLINWPTNILVKFILKRFVVPPVLDSMVRKALSDEPQEAYIFSRALYRVINRTLPTISVNKRSERKPDSPISNANKDKLKTIATHLVKIFEAPADQTRENISRYCEERESATKDTLQKALEEGIIKAGETAVALLHDQNFLVDLFTKTLEATNEALVSHNNFSELRKDSLREERELYIRLNDKVCTESRLLIQNIMNSNYQASDEKSENARSELQTKATMTVIGLRQDLEQMKELFETADEYVRGDSNDPEGNFSQFLPAMTLDRMKDFCNVMQDFTQQMDFTLQENTDAFVAKKEKEQKSAFIQRIDRMIQPLREQGLVIMQSMSKLDQDQKQYYHHFVMYQEVCQVIELLRAVAKNLQEPNDGTESSAPLFEKISGHLEKIHTLSGQLQDLIPVDTSKQMLQDAENFTQKLAEIDRKRALVRDLESLIDQHDGPAALLVCFRQGKQSSALHNFDAEGAKRSIRDILQRSELYDSLSPTVDRMLQFLTSVQRKDFGRLTQLVEEQISSERLKQEFRETLNSQEWQTMPRGREFERNLWDQRKEAFLTSMQEKELSESELQQAALILQQIKGFFSREDILVAYWEYFRQKISLHQTHLIQENEREIDAYLKNTSNLFNYLRNSSDALRKKQINTLYPKLEESQNDLQEKIDQFQKQTENLEIETPISTDTTFKTVGAVAGAGIGLAATTLLPITAAATLISAAAIFASSFFRSNRWVQAAQAGAIGFTAAMLPLPAALIGATVGGATTAYAAKEIPQTAMDYAERDVIPRLQALIKRALSELLKSHTRRGIVFAGLEGFANGGYIPRE